MFKTNKTSKIFLQWMTSVGCLLIGNDQSSKHDPNWKMYSVSACRLSEICLKFLWRVKKYDLKNVATFSRKITTAIPTKTLSVSPLKETTVAIVMKLLLDCGDLWTHAQRFFCQDVDQIPNWAQELFWRKKPKSIPLIDAFHLKSLEYPYNKIGMVLHLWEPKGTFLTKFYKTGYDLWI